MEELTEKLVIALVSGVFGSFLAFIGTSLRNKSAIFRYSVRTERVAVSSEDPLFGSVKSYWRGSEVRNLYGALVEVQNTSSRDFENVLVKVYTGSETQLLGERAYVENTPYAILWSDEYRQALTIVEGQPTPEQAEKFGHSREYTIPVINRGQKLHFTYLCTCPGDDSPPAIFFSMQTKGIRLKRAPNTNVVFNIPVNVLAPRVFVITGMVVLLCVLFIPYVWIAALICAIVGLFAQLPAALEYKVERRIKAALFD